MYNTCDESHEDCALEKPCFVTIRSKILDISEFTILTHTNAYLQTKITL